MGVQASCCRPEKDCERPGLDDAAEPQIKRVFDETGIDDVFEFVYDKSLGGATGGASGSQSTGSESAGHTLEKVPLDKAEHARLASRLEELTRLLLAEEEQTIHLSREDLYWCLEDENEDVLRLRSSPTELFTVNDIVSLDGDLLPLITRELSNGSDAIWQEIDETCLDGPSIAEDFVKSFAETQKHETVDKGEPISTKLPKSTKHCRSRPKSKRSAKAKKNVANLQQLASARSDSSTELQLQLEKPSNTLTDLPDGGQLSKDLPDAARVRELDTVMRAVPRRNAFQTRLDRGELRLRLLDLDGAIADFDEVIRVAPACVLALRLRGLAKMQKGDQSNLQGAQDDFQRAANLGDAKAMSLHQLAVTRRQNASCAAQT